jgi:hypothetical protein
MLDVRQLHRPSVVLAVDSQHEIEAGIVPALAQHRLITESAGPRIEHAGQLRRHAEALLEGPGEELVEPRKWPSSSAERTPAVRISRMVVLLFNRIMRSPADLR